jgi:hypothetical protein
VIEFTEFPDSTELTEFSDVNELDDCTDESVKPEGSGYIPSMVSAVDIAACSLGGAA